MSKCYFTFLSKQPNTGCHPHFFYPWWPRLTPLVAKAHTLGGQASFYKYTCSKNNKGEAKIHSSVQNNTINLQKQPEKHSKYTNNTKPIHIPGKPQHHDPKQSQSQHNRFQHNETHQHTNSAE